MDIISHGLWGGAGFYHRSKKSFWTAFSFGALPDFLAFGWFSIVIFFQYGLGRMNFSEFEPPTHGFVPAYVYEIYNYTHSIFIFAAVFIVVWLIMKRPMLEMLTWGLHILMDIPTHNNIFFPTPFLFPFSSYHFDGISWASMPFFAINWAAIILLYLYLIRRYRKKFRRKSENSLETAELKLK